MWRGKRPKIKHSTFIGDYKEGGYKDIEAKIVALKITWINKLTANDFHAWKAILNFLFDKIGIRSVFHYSFQPSKNTSQKISLFPQFYQELVSFWVSVSEKQPSCISEIVGQCIWSLLVKSNLRASLKLLDNVFGILKQGSIQSSIHAYIKSVS